MGEGKNGIQGRALFTTLKLADVVAVVSGVMGQFLLRISFVLPVSANDKSKRCLRVEPFLRPDWFTYHDTECRVMTTIVLPTYSV